VTNQKLEYIYIYTHTHTHTHNTFFQPLHILENNCCIVENLLKITHMPLDCDFFPVGAMENFSDKSTVCV